MSTSGVTVSFQGDTSALTQSIAKAQVAIEGLTAAVAVSAKSMQSSSASMDQARGSSEGLLATLRDLTIVGFGVGAVFGAIKDGTGALVGGIGAASDGLATMADRLNAVASAPVDGFLAYARNVAYAQRGAEMFTQANDGIVPAIGRALIALDDFGNSGARNFANLTNSIRLYVSGISDTELAAIGASGALKSFSDGMSSSGNFSFPALTNFTAELEKIPGMSDQAAASIETMFASIPNYSTAANTMLIQWLQTVSKTGDEAIVNAKKVSDAFKDSDNGGETLGAVASQIKNIDGQLALAKQLAQSLVPEQAVAMYAAIQKTLQSQIDQVKFLDDEHRRVLETLILTNGEEQGVADILNRELAADKERLAALNSQNLALEVQRQGHAAIVDMMTQQKKLQDAIDAASTPTSKATDLEETKKTLQTVPRKDADDQDVSDEEKNLATRAAILEAGNQTDQGLLAVLNVMKNRLNANYGDYGDSLGSVIKKKAAFTGYTPAAADAIDPNSAQYKHVSELTNKVFGDDPGDDPTNGATHYFNPSLVHPDWDNKMGNITTIGDHKFGNPDGPPVPSSNDATVAKEALQQTNDALREQNALKEGGTATDKANLEISERKAQGAQNEVKAAQELVTAKQAELAAAKGATPGDAGTPGKIREAQLALNDAQASLNEKQVAAESAKWKLIAANAREGSKEQLDARLAAIDVEESASSQDVAKHAEFEAQKASLTKRYAQQQADDAEAAENAKFKNIESSLKSQADLLKISAASGSISKAEETAAVKENLQQQLAAAKAHYAALIELSAGQPQKQRQYRQQAAEIDQQFNAQQIKDAATSDAELTESYKHAFEQIGNTISSSLMGIIQRTSTWRQLMQNVTRQVVSDFLSLGIKMVADFAAQQAKQLATASGMQAAWTALTTAGEAERTSVSVAGAATQAGAAISGMAGTLAADAKAVFGGIFGFLAPILGPAAAAPAAAGASLVTGYDIGAWNLPSDQLAMVHKNELVMPAAQAGAFRDMLTNQANGSGQGNQGQGGGDVHAHAHFHVNAIDAAGVKQFFGTHSKTIIGALNQGVKNGNHIGLRNLARS